MRQTRSRHGGQPINVLKCLEDIISAYERGHIMSAESLERSVITALAASDRAENRTAHGFLSAPALEPGEKLAALRSAHAYLSGVYVPRNGKRR